MSDRAPTILDHVWAEMAGAVGAAAFQPDELGAGGAARGFDPTIAVHAAAAGIVTTAIAAVRRRRRVRPNQPAGVPLDPAVFDQQALGDLLEFLRHSRKGMLTAPEIAHEAPMWQRLIAAGWPAEAADFEPVALAVDLLAAVPAPEAEPVPLRRVEPANAVERALAAVAADERERPRLWRAVHEGDVVLPVVAYELVRPEGPNFQFLAAPLGDTPVVLGFATEERFDALLPPGAQVSRVLAPGKDLHRFWPAGHWLMINAGYEHHAVLAPWEITGLPGGGRAELPHPRAVDIVAPGDDDRADLLERIVAGLTHPAEGTGEAGAAGAVGSAVSAAPGAAGPPGAARAGTVAAEAAGAVGAQAAGVVGRVWWARVRGRAQAAAGHRSVPWQDVLVVGAATVEPGAEAAAVQAVRAALPAGTFPRLLVVGRQAAVQHPFVEAVVAVARPLAGGADGGTDRGGGVERLEGEV